MKLSIYFSNIIHRIDVNIHVQYPMPKNPIETSNGELSLLKRQSTKWRHITVDQFNPERLEVGDESKI